MTGSPLDNNVARSQVGRDAVVYFKPNFALKHHAVLS